MSTDLTLTQNTAQCLRDVEYVGRVEVHNVCTGVVTNVPWGPFDWLGIALALLVLLGVIASGVVFYRIVRGA